MTTSARPMALAPDDTAPPWVVAAGDALVDAIVEALSAYAAMVAVASKPIVAERQARFDEAKRVTEKAIDRLKLLVPPDRRRDTYDALVLAGVPSGVAACCAGALRSEAAAWTRHRRQWGAQ